MKVKMYIIKIYKSYQLLFTELIVKKKIDRKKSMLYTLTKLYKLNELLLSESSNKTMNNLYFLKILKDENKNVYHKNI